MATTTLVGSTTVPPRMAINWWPRFARRPGPAAASITRAHDDCEASGSFKLVLARRSTDIAPRLKGALEMRPPSQEDLVPCLLGSVVCRGFEPGYVRSS